MKKQILLSIYQVFADWSEQFAFTCTKGCTACCTQDVTITEVEGELVIDYCRDNESLQWLASALDVELPHFVPALTTNDYATACLKGKEVEHDSARNGGTCPFLKNDACMIYEARPFSCRAFASTALCRPGSSAQAPQHYLTAATAVSQIIEHLSQKQYWGNMLHILYLLAQQHEESRDTRYPENKNRLVLAQSSCLSSKPLPGFLMSEEDYDLVESLLKAIFDYRVADRRIEDILNNR